jgi:DNA-binding transcriptional ArsR family regulator
MAGSKDDGRRRDKEDHYRCAALAHPLRGRLLRLLAGGRRAGVVELAAELGEAPSRIAYHLRVLVKRDALRVAPRCRPASAVYRWSPGADWARKMLDETDAHSADDG